MVALGSPCRLVSPSGPGSEETCSSTGSISPDGDDLGEATYAMQIKSGEEILVGNGRRLRVLDVVPFEDADELGIVGMLKVEAA
jgi:hypothetical protein